MAKDIAYREENRRKIQAGVNLSADVVRFTLGPSGRNVLLERKDTSPLETNNGYEILKEIELEEQAENLGVQLIREAAARMKDMVGDGSTTAVVLAQTMIQEGFRNIAAGANPVEIRKGMQPAAQLAAAAIRKLSKPVESHEAIVQTAAIAAQDEQIGETIAEAIEKVGMDGVIDVEEYGGTSMSLDVMSGMQFERGYLSPEMITDQENLTAELDEPYILLTDRKITQAKEILPVLEKIIEKKKPLFIVAEALEGEALGLLVMNHKRGVIRVAAVHPPAYGEGRRARMEDLAILTGGVFVSEELGYSLENVTLEMLGSAKHVTVGRKKTEVIGGNGDRQVIQDKIQSIRNQIKKTKYDFDKQQLKERLARLTDGAAVIHVGAVTEVEMMEKKALIENAVHTVRAALEEGVVSGGGTIYLSTIPVVKAYMKTLEGDRRTGAEIILKALERPAFQIAENAGMDGKVVVEEIKCLGKGMGFNAVQKSYVNMLEAGIMDAAKAARLALESAASLSAVLLTTEAGVINAKEEG